MKKLFTLLLAVGLATSALAQVESTDSNIGTPAPERSNDIVINPIALVLGVANFSYERVLNHDSGIGIATMFILDDYTVDASGYWQVTPYYRYYFGKKRAGGFFVEGFGGLVGQEVSTYHYMYDPQWGYMTNSYTTTENVTSFGLGVGFGGKWITKNNIVFEVGTGLGRLFGEKADARVFAKGMLGIGKRF
ncbi:MAG: DUF3575 domain-containing protein [Chryseobacterium sp.]|nr:MAG: DUF3575 domain-containing protein [Chryseobacterium sp.]